MKTLKFDSNLADMILKGEKTSTWRLFDDKNLQAGDIVEFIKRPELTVFAKAKLTKVFEKAFEQLSQEDKIGHEKYKSEEEMYHFFSQVYQKPVSRSTPVKVIKFKLI